jgi:cyanophycinase
MTPKGKLLLIGGDENICGQITPDAVMRKKQFRHLEVLRDMLPKHKSTHRIEVITTSTSVSDEIKNDYTEVFHNAGYESIGFINIFNKEEARNEEYEKRIAEAGSILFCGSDQFCIPTIIGGTQLEDIIIKKFSTDEDFIVAGLGAGAMAITAIILWESDTEEKLTSKMLKTGAGLGLLKNCIVDTDLIKKGRFGRLAHAVIVNPADLGIGLAEDTALVITGGTLATCYGSGTITLIDGKHITQTNMAEASKEKPVYVENIKVHLLAHGCTFLLDERKLVPPAQEKQPVDTKQILEHIFTSEGGK